jgi:hypothetical protein
MSYGIFRVNKELTAVLDKEAVKLEPSLAMLTDQQVMYIILVYDYIDSPYRLKPLEEKQKIARDRLFEGNDPEKLANVKKAIKAYQGLIYDSRRSQIEIYKTKISKLQKVFDGEDDNKAMQDIIKTIDIIRKDQDRIEKEVAIDEEKIELRGGNKLTFIEQWKLKQQNSIQK